MQVQPLYRPRLPQASPPPKRSVAAASVDTPVSQQNTGELPRFGAYPTPLLTKNQSTTPRFSGQVEHAIHLNNLDQENNHVIAQQRRLHPDLVALNALRQRLVQTVEQAGLTPNPVDFYVVPDLVHLKMAARQGFLERYPHWSWGQELFTQFLRPRMERKNPFVEVVQPNMPTKAFLPDHEPSYAKKARILFALARSDFQRNNIYFKRTNPHLVSQFADHARHITALEEKLAEALRQHTQAGTLDTLSEQTGIHADHIQKYLAGKMTAQDVSKTTIEEFIDKVHSVRELVDLTREPQTIQDNPSWERMEYDILGFLSKHAEGLKGWQRDILTLMRRETYALIPSEKTRMMAAGWAYYWNDKLNAQNPNFWDWPNMTREASWTSRIFEPDPVKINPYQLGFELFRHAEQSLREKHKDAPDRDQKVTEELLRIRREHYDVSFLREYLTPKVVQALMMYNYDPKSPDTKSQTEGTQLLLSTRDYEAIKSRLIEMFQNVRQPLIGIAQANYGEEGALVLNHAHTYDLKDDYARKTLLNISRIMGRTVYLETQKTDENGAVKPVTLWAYKDSFGELSNALDHAGKKS